MDKNLKGLSGFTRTASIRWDSSWPELASPAERFSLLSYLEGRFGINGEVFEGFLFFRKKKSWWICTDTPLLTSVSRLKISRMGMKAFQKVGQFLKPTTRMIQVFGIHATKAKIIISEDNLLDLQKGKYIDAALGIEQGYVILCLDENRILGLGLYVNGRISSQISRKALKESMIGGEVCLPGKRKRNRGSTIPRSTGTW